MAFIYDLSDTWNNAGISFNGIKLNATDTASAAGSRLLDLQINGASKFTVGKTGAVIATGLIESTVGGFKFPDGTTQTTKATVNSVSGTGSVNGITLTGSVTDSGSLTLGGTLGNIANNQLTNSAITINGTSTPLGGSIAVGTVTSVAGTGTVNGLTLTGSITTSGSLTLGGTLGNIANSQLTNSAITINGTSTALGGSISVGTVTSVAALTLGTSGTDLASSVANGTTTPVITLNVPTASATNRGALSPSDWSTFNAKQAALVSGANIKTVGGASLLGSGDVGTIGLAYGGTGATTESGARTALGLGTAAVLNAGVAGGVATLDGSGTVPTSQLPGAVLGGLNYQGTWNASTNVPTLESSTGSKGYYYVVSTAGSTNLNGITDWKIGDWAVYDGSTWQKVDNTDAVSSVNGYTGAVVLTTSDVAQGTNLYFTQAAARASVSAGTGINYNSTTGVITNSAPDQTVALTGAGTTTVTGTYPNFTITSNDSTVGTVTSVAASGGTTGLTFTGSPITTSGTLTLGGTLDLDNGGTGATTAAGARTALGLGTAATTDASAYATAAQGAKADTAVQTIASADGSVVISGTTAIDLSVAVAGSTSNVLLPVRNTTGATLTKGTAVYISGATGQLSTVSKAIASGDATSAQTLGLVTANISNNANGNVTLIGTITNIDTSAYTDGQQLYLSPTTAGTLTATKPYAPQHLVYMAVVESAHPSQGKLFVKVQNGYEMDELHDVSAQSPTNGQTLVYNSTTSLWEKNTVSLTAGVNGTLPVANGGTGATTLGANGVLLGNGTSAISATAVGATGQVLVGNTGAAPTWATLSGIGVTSFSAGTTGLTPASATTGAITLAGTLNVANGGTGTSTAFTAGSVVFAGASGVYSQDNANLFWDNSNDRLGIGTATPAAKLDVIGNIRMPSGNFLYWAGASELIEAVENNRMAFWVNSAERMRINSSGNVGIGTNNPIAKLDLVGSADTYARINDGTVNLVLQSYSTGSSAIVGTTSNHPLTLWANAAERMRIDTSGNTTLGIGGGARLVAYTDQTIASLNTAGSAYTDMKFDGLNLLFRTGSGAASERMRIDTSGNVGIGTSSPGEKLQVVGSIRVNTTGTIFSNIYSSPGNVQTWFVNNGSSSDTYLTSDTAQRYRMLTGIGHRWETAASGTAGASISWTERMVLDLSGNVGIGTSSPLFKLVISNAGGAGLEIDPTALASSPLIQSYNRSGAAYTQLGFDALQYVWRTSGTERMRIDSSGNVGIGTNSVAGRLHSVSTTGFVDPTLLCGNGVGTFRIVFQNGAYAGVPANKPWLHSYDDIYIGSDAVTSFNVMSGGVNTFKVDTNGNAIASGQVNSKNTALFFGDGTDNSATVYATGGPVKFFANAAERMRIDSSGNVVIGNTASPYVTGGRTVFAVNGSSSALMALQSAGSNRGYLYGDGSIVALEAESGCTLKLNAIGAQPMTFFTSNTERARIESDGVLKLNVGGVSNTHQFFYNESGGEIQLIDSTGAGPILIDNVSGLARFYKVGSGAISMGTTGANYFQFITNGAERMRIDSSGNVGIGTSSPTTRLQIGDIGATDATFQGRIKLEDTSASLQAVGGLEYATSSFGAGYGWKINSIDSSGVHLVFGTRQNSATWTETMRLDANGNVGIGTTSPVAKLQVVGTSRVNQSGATRYRSDWYLESGSVLLNGFDDTGGVYLPVGFNFSVYTFNSGASERMRITSGGNVLVNIGTVVQGGRFGVADTANDVCIGMYASGTGNTTGTYLNCGDDNNIRFRVFTNGNVQNTNNSYGAISDIKVKDNIKDATPKLQNLMQVRVVNYNLKAQPEQKHIGVVAQELEEIFPSLVEETADRDAKGKLTGETTKSVKYSVFVPMLIKALQEANEKIDTLAARVAQLEGN